MKPKSLKFKLTAIAILLVLAVGGIFLYQFKNQENRPPELSITSFEALMNSALPFHTFTAEDESSYQAPSTLGSSIKLTQGVHFYYPNADITIDSIIRNIKPIANNKVLIVYYKPEDQKFYVYPKGPFENTTVISDTANFKILKNHGFIIISKKETDIWGVEGEKTALSGTASSDYQFLNSLNGWVLIPSMTSISNYLNTTTEINSRIGNVYKQNGSNNFTEVTKVGSTYTITFSEGYYMMWLNLNPVSTGQSSGQSVIVQQGLTNQQNILNQQNIANQGYQTHNLETQAVQNSGSLGFNTATIAEDKPQPPRNCKGSRENNGNYKFQWDAPNTLANSKYQLIEYILTLNGNIANNQQQPSETTQSINATTINLHYYEIQKANIKAHFLNTQATGDARFVFSQDVACAVTQSQEAPQETMASAPSNIKVEYYINPDINDNEYFTIRWTPPVSVPDGLELKGYELKYSVKNAPTERSNSLNSETTSFTDSVSNYQYLTDLKLKAKYENSSGAISYSEEINKTMQPVEPLPPLENLKMTTVIESVNRDGDQKFVYKITWEKPADYNSVLLYNLKYSIDEGKNWSDKNGKYSNLYKAWTSYSIPYDEVFCGDYLFRLQAVYKRDNNKIEGEFSQISRKIDEYCIEQ